MTEELAADDLAAPDRIAEEKQHRSSLHLADDRVMRQQERDQRHEEDGEAREADDDDIELVDAHAARRYAAKEGKRQGKCGQ